MRQSIKDAVNQVSENQNKKSTQTRSQVNAETSQNLLKNKVSEARQAIRKSVKAEIIVGGISDALSDIALGNFDDIELTAIEALDTFTNSFNTTHQNILEAEISDIPLLKASSDLPEEIHAETVEKLEEIYQESPTTSENESNSNDSKSTNSLLNSSRQKKGKS